MSTQSNNAPTGDGAKGMLANGDGAIGSQFEKDGAIGGAAQKIGGPLAADGAIGKNFNSDGAIGGTVHDNAAQAEGAAASSRVDAQEKSNA